MYIIRDIRCLHTFCITSGAQTAGSVLLTQRGKLGSASLPEITAHDLKSSDLAIWILIPPEFVANEYHVVPTLRIEGSGKFDEMTSFTARLWMGPAVTRDVTDSITAKNDSIIAGRLEEAVPEQDRLS